MRPRRAGGPRPARPARVRSAPATARPCSTPMDEDVRASPDLARLAALDRHALIVTARRAPAGTRDFVSRFFAPALSVGPEDPATRVRRTARSSPYWAACGSRHIPRCCSDASGPGDPQVIYVASVPRQAAIHRELRGPERVRIGGLVAVPSPRRSADTSRSAMTGGLRVVALCANLSPCACPGITDARRPRSLERLHAAASIEAAGPTRRVPNAHAPAPASGSQAGSAQRSAARQR